MRQNKNSGFGTTELLLSLSVVLIVVLVGIYASNHNKSVQTSDKYLIRNSAAAYGIKTPDNQLQAVESDVAATSAQLSSTNSSLNDKSTFIKVP